jgi:hypothetical protein
MGMADAFYDAFRGAMLGNPVHSLVDLDLDTIKIILYDEGTDALNLADQDIADIIAGARVATGTTATKTVGQTTGVFDHADLTFPTVSGATVESMTYWKDSGTEATSPLICNIDSATGLPLTPNGGDVNWVPNASGVFQITG